MSVTLLFLIMMAAMYPLARGAVTLSGSKNGRIGDSDDTGAKILVFIIFLIFAVVLGFRAILAAVNDEYAYRNRILSMVGKNFFTVVKDNSEVLDTLLCWTAARIFPGESQWGLVFYSFITYAFFVFFIYKYCDNFELGILLLFLLNIVNVSLNTMQQMEAVAFSTLAIPYVYKRKFFKYAIIIALSALIHNSAIILIAVYFIANMKPWSGKYIGVAFLFVIVMLVFNSVAPQLFSRMEILGDYESSYGNGVRTITVIVAFIPVAFAFFMRNFFPEDDADFNCAINMSLVYAMVYLVSTQNLYVARFAMYIQPYLIVLYTKAITHLRRENLSNIVYFGLVVGYGATMVYFTQNMKYRFAWPL